MLRVRDIERVSPLSRKIIQYLSGGNPFDLSRYGVVSSRKVSLHLEFDFCYKIVLFAGYASDIAKLHEHGAKQNTAGIHIRIANNILFSRSIREINMTGALHLGHDAVSKKLSFWFEISHAHYIVFRICIKVGRDWRMMRNLLCNIKAGCAIVTFPATSEKLS
jgi:hypothetical protein